MRCFSGLRMVVKLNKIHFKNSHVLEKLEVSVRIFPRAKKEPAVQKGTGK
jgi:hypothetical protein